MKILAIGFVDSPAERKDAFRLSALARDLCNTEDAVRGVLVASGDFAPESSWPVQHITAATTPWRNQALPQELGHALKACVESTQADVVLFGGDEASRELAMHLAAALGWQASTRVGRLARAGDAFTFSRPAFSGCLFAQESVRGGKIVLSLDLDAFPEGIGTCGEGCAVDRLVLRRAAGLSQIVEMRVEKQPKRNPLPEAGLVVVGGRGIGGEKGMREVEALARAFGGEAAATRPAALAGWTDIDRIVGQSGVTVCPEIALLLGVSGAGAFLAGLRAKRIIAVNIDPDAPIFRFADIGIVADWRAFTAELGGLA